MIENKFEKVKIILKTEFFGIDEQIVQVVNAIESWETTKEYQLRPNVVSLIGLTGTGKTALLNRTIELLNLEKHKFYIKFGGKTSGLNYNIEQNDKQDSIFILDEFQYFKTIREDGSEIEKNEDDSINIIWELLDGGLINLYGDNSDYSYNRFSIKSSLYNLLILNSIDTEYSNGIFFHPDLAKTLKKVGIDPVDLERLDEYKTENHTTPNKRYLPKKTKVFGPDGVDLPKNAIEDLENIINNNTKEIRKDKPKSDSENILPNVITTSLSAVFEFYNSKDLDSKFENKADLVDYLVSLNDIKSLIKFFQELLNSKTKIQVKDFSKSLIFVVANLDECYKISKELNSDLDADYFYKETKKINILNVRKSLLKRFRPEQIARLGSNYIIYPSLNKEAFKNIIEKEFNLFKNNVISKFSNNEKINVVDVVFDENIKKLIYKEGVFPIIGARSVTSTINQIITDKFSVIIKKLLNLNTTGLNRITINFSYNKSSKAIIIKYNSIDNATINEIDNIKYQLKIDNLRYEKNKGKQTHIAVHEAGHAVCSIVLNNSFPEVVYSVVLENKNSGFNLLDYNEHSGFLRKNTYLNDVATILGGYVAEKMIFGDENLADGSSSDIEKMTQLLSTLYKECGFSDHVGNLVSKNFTSTSFVDSNNKIVVDNEIDDLIKEDIKKGLKLAKKTLEKQKVLLLKISEYLSKNVKITNKQLKEMSKKYLVDVDYKTIYNDKHQFYVEKLNEELKKIK